MPEPVARDQATAERAFQELRSRIPATLIGGEGWERLLARVGRLPKAAVDCCGFEFRLDAPDPAADLFVAAVPDGPVARRLVNWSAAEAPDSPAGALARHLRELARPQSPLRAQIEITGLEYDVADIAPGARPPPGVFFKLRVAGARGTEEPQKTLPIRALANAVGWSDDTEERRAVERVVAALPPGGLVTFIGAMPGRSPRGVRLIINGMEHSGVAATLERVGWRGSAQSVGDTLLALADLLPRCRLAMDVAPKGVGPHIGIELFANVRRDQLDSWVTTTRTDWRPAVEAFTERGWCLPAKAKGLLDWCSLERFYNRHGMHVCKKGINHMKLTFSANRAAGEVSAKAYGGLLFMLAK